MVRLHVNLNDETAQALQSFATSRNVSKTEALRIIIGTFKYLDDAVTFERQTLILRSSDGSEKGVSFE